MEPWGRGVGELTQVLLFTRRFSHQGISSQQAAPTHLGPAVTCDSHAELQFPGGGVQGVAGRGGGWFPLKRSPDAKLQPAQLIGKRRRNKNSENL